MTDISELVRKNIRNLAPYSSARDEYSGETGIFLDANENPFGTLNRYPDPYQRRLKTEISKLKDIAPENIFLGNGSDEIIDICFRTFCNPGADKALIFPPTYGMYEVSAGINDAALIKVPLTADFTIDMPAVKNVLTDEKLKLIFICSPNNPTGNYLKSEDIEELVRIFRGIVIVDEAYIDFTSKPSLSPLINSYGNLIVMQTFSKAFGLASARIGMAFANSEIISYFNKIKPPYNISFPNQKAALEVLNKRGDNRNEIHSIIKERERLSTIIAGLPLTEKIFPADANFLLVKVEDSTRLYNYLAGCGIIVRNRHSVIRNCLRITVGKRSENNALIEALKKYKP